MALVLTTTEEGDCLVAAMQHAGPRTPASVEVAAEDLASGSLEEAGIEPHVTLYHW